MANHIGTAAVSDPGFLIAGIARNCAETLFGTVETLYRAFSWGIDLKIFIVESDSDDHTVAVLEKLRSTYDCLEYVSLGRLRESIPSRTDRIAHCRNLYLDYFRKEGGCAPLSHIAVADLDGINNRLTADSVKSCFERIDWDVCTANQRGPYYDIYALRHDIWCPDDWWVKADFLRGLGVDEGTSVRVACHDLMVTIDPATPWIEVDSAFGGIALYRGEAIRSGNAIYVGHDDEGNGICEHVPFHDKIRQERGRIFINPAFINAGYTEHSLDLIGRKAFSLHLGGIMRIATHRLAKWTLHLKKL